MRKGSESVRATTLNIPKHTEAETHGLVAFLLHGARLEVEHAARAGRTGTGRAGGPVGAGRDRELLAQAFTIIRMALLEHSRV